MKNKVLSTCLQVSYRDSLGEFSSTFGVLVAERVKALIFTGLGVGLRGPQQICLEQC